MGCVDDFLTQYRREYDFYDQAARLAAQILDNRLQEAGIRSIVTSRAKSVSRLAPKLAEREALKNYQTIHDIYEDIVDLAGIRVALYFPGQRRQVDTLVRQVFTLLEPAKEFPGSSTPKYKKRFSGYSATHYRAHLRDPSLSDAQKRYSEARIEIQVASVLMHAWSEVEHDLVYKPLQGLLSIDEYEILDELNGLVIAGEIALERLQRSGEQRVALNSRPFGNHYELAAHLLGTAGAVLGESVSDGGMGRVDLLFEMLKTLNIRTPEQIAKYVEALHSDTEKRPVAEQLVDQLLAEDASRYAVYEKVRENAPDARARHTKDGTSDVHKLVGLFIAGWGDFERAMTARLPREPYRPSAVLNTRTLLDMGVIDLKTSNQLEPIRRLRNMVVHGAGPVEPAEVQDATQRLRQITEQLSRRDSCLG